MFGQGAEIALQAERRAGFAEPDLDVARRQDPVLVLQRGLVEADGRRKFADEEVEAGGEVALLDPRLTGPADAGAGERQRRAFGPHEEAFATEACDEVGAREVAGKLEARHHGREGFERKITRGGFDQHAGRTRSLARERLA